MGCGGSKDGVANGQGGGGGGKVVPYDRRPKISVRIGPDVKKLECSPQCIFIFGGPGSRKGRVVDDLRSSYGFQFICGEDLIFQELPKKVSNVMKLETIKDIKNLLEEDPSHMTLAWLLTCIERRVELARGSGTTFLVDIIPNLKYLLRLEGVSNDDLSALQKFEEKYPISFGLNLAIPVDKVLSAKSNHCVKADVDSKLKKESGGQSDEADSSRTQKRAALYEQCAKPFLNYFTNSNRLVTVDVACGQADLIWHQVNDVMMDLEFHPSRVVNTVVVFGWSDEDVGGVDTEKYLMHRIKLRDIVENPNEEAEKLLVQLSEHLDNLSRETDSFVVSLEGTKLAEMASLEQVGEI